MKTMTDCENLLCILMSHLVLMLPKNDVIYLHRIKNYSHCVSFLSYHCFEAEAIDW